MHWPELHALCKADTNSELANSTGDVRQQNVINNQPSVLTLWTEFSHKD